MLQEYDLDYRDELSLLRGAGIEGSTPRPRCAQDVRKHRNGNTEVNRVASAAEREVARLLEGSAAICEQWRRSQDLAIG